VPEAGVVVTGEVEVAEVVVVVVVEEGETDVGTASLCVGPQ
jgi:hypothetical protein